jgi:hypothetical protein
LPIEVEKYMIHQSLFLLNRFLMGQVNAIRLRKGWTLSTLCVTTLIAMALSSGVSQTTPQAQPAQAAATAPVTPAPASAPAAAPKPVSDKAQQRKDQIAADSAKLQQLAAELKTEMDKSTKDTLSLTVVKKAEEIEKLAHKVRDEMKASLVN